jgi:hypothetical protein
MTDEKWWIQLRKCNQLKSRNRLILERRRLWKEKQMESEL